MARVADVRRLGSADKQFYTRPPPAGPASRSKAGRSLPVSMSLSLRAEAGGGGGPAAQAQAARPQPSLKRPTSRGNTGGGWSSGPIRFAAPEGAYGRVVTRDAQDQAMEEEDLFEVLQRRIDQQKSELREGREIMDHVMKSEVKELREAVDG